MPMEETEIKCPDCGKFLTDVDGMLECQDVYAYVQTDDVLTIAKNGCGGSTGWTDKDWMVWYPGPEMPPNPMRLTLEERRNWNRTSHYRFPKFLKITNEGHSRFPENCDACGVYADGPL